MTLDEILAAFAVSSEAPTATLKAASGHADGLAAIVNGLIDKLGNGVHLLPSQMNVLMFGLPVVAVTKSSEAFPAILKLMRLPEEALEGIYPSHVSMMLTRLLITTWDGDVDALFHPLEHADIADEARIALFRALAFLTFDGRVDRLRLLQLLERFERDNVLGNEDFGWFGWRDAVVLLGVKELEPALHRVWSLGLFSEWEDLERQRDLDQLARAAADPRDLTPFEADKCTPIDDPAEAMEWIDEQRRLLAGLDDDDAEEASNSDGRPPILSGAEDESGPTWDQIHWLSGFLASRQVPETTMSLEMLDGFLTALSIGPEPVKPEKYVPLIWGSEGASGPTWDSEEQAAYFAGALQAMTDELAELIETGEPIEPMLARVAPEDIGAEWAQGFEEGVYLSEAAWERLLASERGKDLLWSVLALADIDGDDEYEVEPPSAAERETLLRRLPENIKLIARFWREGDQVLRREPVRVEKVGRNDPCPCGSGKKYKKCCGGATPATLH